jgi:GTPase-associated system helical domain
MHNILSGFLNAGLLPIGEDDEKLKLLEAAAGQIAKQITAAPMLAYRFSLIGFDDRVTSEDPAIKKAEEAVLSKWPTIVNKIGARPVQVYRAVILRALEIAAVENSELRQAVSLIAQNEPVLQSKRKERDAINAMLQQFEGNAADELSEAWVNPVDMGFPKLSGKIKKLQINKDNLTVAIARAAGPQDQAGNALNDPNPHWPNAGQPWSNEFVGRATDAISAAIQNASKGIVEEMQNALRETMQALVRGVERLAIRDAKSELLWIRISMYSPSAISSYRDLKLTDLILHAVLDVSRAVARSAPPSVEFFIRELVSTLAKKKLRLTDALTAIGPKLTTVAESKTIFADPLPTFGRRAWLDVAVRPDTGADFEQQTGVSSTYEENAAEMAVRFYRELQIRKLLSPTR